MGRRLLLLASTALWGLGCAGFTPTASECKLPRLPKPKMALDSVVLEVATIQIPADQPDWTENLWREVDEQQIAPGLRHRLHRNGMRCGVVGIHLPLALRQAIDEHQQSSLRRTLSDVSSNTDTLAEIRQVTAGPGLRSDVQTMPVREQVVILVDDGESVAGATYHEAQTVFALRAEPVGDGSARVELVPEIQFGPPKQRWTSRGNGMFQLEAGRDKTIFDWLRIETQLTPGQTLLVTAEDAARSLGGNFFGRGTVGRTQQKMLLVRLAQAQQDDLFAPPVEPGDRLAVRHPPAVGETRWP